MSNKCRAFGCENEPTQRLVRKTNLIEARGYHEEGATWNSSNGLLCDDCSTNLFHTKYDPLEHGFFSLQDAARGEEKLTKALALLEQAECPHADQTLITRCTGGKICSFYAPNHKQFIQDCSWCTDRKQLLGERG
jgi:hypothetical protein